MEERTYLCLFDLDAYDKRVGPALRLYAREFEPKSVVALLREALKNHGAGVSVAGVEDFEHWIVSIEPDAGHKPSEQTVRELSAMLIRAFCLPREPVELAQFTVWLSPRSEWFSDLISGGEELAGGSLEFTLGKGRLVATRQQIAHFADVLTEAGAPPEELATAARKLRELVDLAVSRPSYTLLKTTLPV